MRRSDWFFLMLLAMVVAGVAGGLYFSDSESDRARRAEGTLAEGTDRPRIGGPFELVDQNGAPVTERDLTGRWTLIYFGYTYCPDVCPVTLSNMTQALELLGAQADKVNPWFVTVDPMRDTVEELKPYAENFDPRIRFLTGTDEQVTRALTAYRVFRSIRDENPADPDYFVDHTSLIYLMGPDGAYVATFAHTATGKEIADRLRRFL